MGIYDVREIYCEKCKKKTMHNTGWESEEPDQEEQECKECKHFKVVKQ